MAVPHCAASHLLGLRVQDRSVAEASRNTQEKECLPGKQCSSRLCKQLASTRLPAEEELHVTIHLSYKPLQGTEGFMPQ